jgi:outer membrane protein TolC
LCVPPLFGYAQEPLQTDQIKTAPTPTVQNPVVTPDTDQLKSMPTPTSQNPVATPDTAQLKSIATPTPQNPAALPAVDSLKSTPTITDQLQSEAQHTDELKSAPTTTDQVQSEAQHTDDLKSAPTTTDQYKAATGRIANDNQDRSGGGMIAQGETLTLAKCIDIALGKNPTIVASANAVDVSRSKVGEARSGYYPQLSASAGYGRTKVLSTSTSNNDTTAYNQYSGTLAANQTIFDFGKTLSSVSVSKYNLESSRSDLNATQNLIVLSVKQAYYTVLQAKRNRDVAADVIKQFQLHLDQAQGFYEVGTKAKIDVIKAQVDLSNAKLSLINTDNALKIAWINLDNAMGVPDSPEYAIEDNLEFQPYAITLEEATVKAFENRPDLKSIIAKRQAAEANLNLQRADYFPVVTGNASYSRIGTPENLPVGQSPNTWTAGVAVTFPIFSGFLTNYRVAEAKSNLYILRANEESVRQLLLLEVRQSYLNLQAAEASIGATELALKQAKENLDLANGRYAAGVGSPIEVSDAFTTYITAQANFTGALYNYKTAQANIEKATGMQ